MFPIIVSHIAEKEKTFLLVNILFCVFSLSAFLFCVRIFRISEKLAEIEGFLPKCRQADHKSAKISNKGDQRL